MIASCRLHALDPHQYLDEVLRVLPYWPRDRYLEPARALQFAHDQQQRGKVNTPAIVGAILQLGRCFDLMDTRFTADLPVAFARFKQAIAHSGQPLPANDGRTPDKLLLRRDCAVLNYYLRELDRENFSFDTVRCGFVEGPEAFEGSGIRYQSHIQVAVRTPTCVVGVFLPRMDP